ncbi:hypothetical protein TWF694_010854 [Orbilia ellipsospora]|uniref:F-box domain-containing protein n=1 Tax=Orbilia ellipsospora TaxID=2528407 RepID=A0AAV9X9V2_9PEZI
MAIPATTIDQPGPLIQWPQYEKRNPLASASSTTPSSAFVASELEPPTENIVKCQVPSSSVGSSLPSMSTSDDIKCKRTVQTSPIPTPNIHDTRQMDEPNKNIRSIKGVFSKMTSKVLSITKSYTFSASDLDKSNSKDGQKYLSSVSAQPGQSVPQCNRGKTRTPGLRRSWLFDKKMMPVLPLENLPKARPSTAALFFRLPVELQLEIVTKLIYSDIICLRKTSRAFNSLIVTNEHEIARRQIENFIEKRYVILYPPNSPTKPSFAYLSKLATKSIVASELSRALVSQLYEEFQDKYFESHASEAKPLILRYMSERLRFSIMIIQHFLEQFAERKLRHDRHNGYASRADDIQLQEAIMEKYYTTEQLVEASDFYRLTLYLLWQNVAISGGHDRVKRIWAIMTDSMPAVQDLTKFMVVGGVPEIRNIYRKPKSSARRKAMARYSTCYKNEQARNKLGATRLPRVYRPPENIKRYAKLAISPNIFHLWIHPAQNVLFRNDVIEGLNQFRCIDDIVGLLLDGWEEWAYGAAPNGDFEGDSDVEDEDEDEISVTPAPTPTFQGST